MKKCSLSHKLHKVGYAFGNIIQHRDYTNAYNPAIMAVSKIGCITCMTRSVHHSSKHNRAWMKLFICTFECINWCKINFPFQSFCSQTTRMKRLWVLPMLRWGLSRLKTSLAWMAADSEMNLWEVAWHPVKPEPLRQVTLVAQGARSLNDNNDMVDTRTQAVNSV